MIWKTRNLVSNNDDNRILVTGGAGFVGAHFCAHAMKTGLHVTVIDNFSTGHRKAFRGHELVELDLRDRAVLLDYLSSRRFHTVFHFAACCLVGESMADPGKYYGNNVCATLNLLEAMRVTNHERLVFSSTCSVYGVPSELPLKEDHPKLPISPYGRSKLAVEHMIEDFHHACGLRWAALRYFNAAGCEPSEGLGEDHQPETHLIPNVVRRALKQDKELTIFGDDYPTADGTCIRDYVHVTDLAEAHIMAMCKLDELLQIRLNLGTGKGCSNMEVVRAVEHVAGLELRPAIGPRRPGDPPELVADAAQAGSILDWRPERSDLTSMVEEVYRWMSDHPDGYRSCKH